MNKNIFIFSSDGFPTRRNANLGFLVLNRLKPLKIIMYFCLIYRLIIQKKFYR